MLIKFVIFVFEVHEDKNFRINYIINEDIKQLNNLLLRDYNNFATSLDKNNTVTWFGTSIVSPLL